MIVLFLCAAPVHQMHFSDMYITDIGMRYRTEIWDISMLTGMKDQVNQNYPEIPKIRSKVELADRIDCLKKKDKKIVVITNLLIFNLYLICHLLHARGIPVLQIDKEGIIFWMQDQYLLKHPDEMSEADKRKYRWKHNSVTRRIFSFLEYRHVRFDYILGCNNYYPDASRHFVPIHSLKYDEAVISMQQERILHDPYILFMDAGLAHLPSFSGKENSINQDEYLRNMNHVFDILESKYKIPVVIAAHPKAEYPENPFRGRKVILYKTASLARYAEFVVAHYSTSLIDLVYQKKPILFLYSKAYMHSTARTVLMTECEYANLLKAPLVDIMKKEDLDNIQLSYDEDAYDSFLHQHIVCAGRENDANAKIILEFLGKLENRIHE